MNEIKTNTVGHYTLQLKQQPFFSKEGDGSFFSKSNEATSSFFSPRTIQPKPVSPAGRLTIDEPNDKYEVEADAMADKVVQRLSTNNNFTSSGISDGNTTIQTKCTECGEEEKLNIKEDPELSLKTIFESNGENLQGNLQMKSLESHFVQTKCPNCEENENVQAKSEEANSKKTHTLESNLNSSNGSGRPLSSDVNDSMGSAFDADFGGVRVHTDKRAVQMNKELNAQAFTHRNNIYFNEGKYDTNSTIGKHLLAHELTHTLQQNGSGMVQKTCDTAVIVTRTVPVFFPQERNILRVFQGRSTIRKWGGANHAVGLVQQALVDLGNNLGSFGPNADGVDRKFGPVTEGAISSFQTSETIATSNLGVVDQATLKCLDDKRSKLVVPAHQSSTVDEDQYLIETEISGRRDEDIYFARGLSTLDSADKAKISKLLGRPVNSLQGCNLTLSGFVSEDEHVMTGPSLATDRINAVNNELVRQGHDTTGPDCPVPPAPVRTPDPQPAESSGVFDYPSRRKVEIVPPGQSAATASCSVTSPDNRALELAEAADLAEIITLTTGWIDEALLKLAPGNSEGDAALETYFGPSANRSLITGNLVTWREHIATNIPSRNQAGTECNSVCRIALAFNNGRGGEAMMTLCPPFFESEAPDVLPGLEDDQTRAFVVLHEAGHGSIGTRDFGYSHRRMIEFLSEYPTLAERNTDSYTLMILCLNNVGSFCDEPTTIDNYVGFSNPAEKEKARRGVAWLQSWLEWSEQDTSGVYTYMDEAKNNGDSLLSTQGYYAGVYDLIIAEFGIRRPPRNASPTLGEQMTVAAILERIMTMNRATKPGLNIKKDSSSSPHSIWSIGPGRKLTLEDSYFTISSDRIRVETILELIIASNTAIDTSMRDKYENLIKAIVVNGYDNQP